MESIYSNVKTPKEEDFDYNENLINQMELEILSTSLMQIINKVIFILL